MFWGRTVKDQGHRLKNCQHHLWPAMTLITELELSAYQILTNVELCRGRGTDIDLGNDLEDRPS